MVLPMATMRRKRANGEGTIYFHEGMGVWVGMLDLGYVEGKRKRKKFTGKTRQEVAKKLATVAVAREAGIEPGDDRERLDAFLDRWLLHVKATVRPGTYESYASVCKVHLKPNLGRIPLTKLSIRDVQELIDRKAAQTKTVGEGKEQREVPALSARRVAMIRNTLRMALQQAMKWDLIPRNVAALTKAPRQEQQPVVPLTVKQGELLLKAVAEDRLRALWTVFLLTGLRRGEALGLRWQDVDLDRASLTVMQSLQRQTGKGLVFVEPKSRSSRRTIPLPAMAVQALREHSRRMAEERLRVGPEWQDSGLVFVDPFGGPIDPDRVTDQLKVILEEAGLPSDRPVHKLRHSCASVLISQKVDALVVKEVLGHSQVSLTLSVYAHLFPGADRVAASAMDAAFGG